MPIISGILVETLWFGYNYIPMVPKGNSNMEKFKDVVGWQLSPKSLSFKT